MKTLGYTKTPLEAQLVAMELRRAGVRAVAFCQPDMMGAFVRSSVLLYDESQTEEAETILARMAESPERVDPSWEQDLTPDLSRLPAHIRVECPDCRVTLPNDADLRVCPSCRREVDVVALVLERHGPEALGGCYDAGESLSADVVARFPLSCPKCRYSLDGLERRGRCPECGTSYDKDVILSWFH